VSSFGSTAAWLVPLAVLLLAIVSVPVRILDDEGLPRYRALVAAREEARTQNARLTRDLRELDAEVRALRDDPEALERIARDEFGMVRDGEVVFQFDE
jgi:cell division protein FtsB